MTFGEKLVKIRREAGLTQADLADIIRWDPGNLCRLENDSRSPNLTTIMRLAEGLDIEARDLIPDRADYQSHLQETV